MYKNNLRNKLFSSIFSVCFIYFLIVAAVYFVCFFDKEMLYKLLVKYNTANELPFPITDFDLKTICSELMQYLSGKLTFLETKIEINGVITDFYSIRSKIHMSDVRVIFKNMLIISYFAIAICIFSLSKLLNNQDETIKQIKKSFTKTLIVFSIILLIFVTIACINFDTFFIKFHQLLFTNDFWLLDPREDYIICLLPEKVFITIGIRMVIVLLIFLGLSFACLQILSKIQPPQEAK